MDQDNSADRQVAAEAGRVQNITSHVAEAGTNAMHEQVKQVSAVVDDAQRDGAEGLDALVGAYGTLARGMQEFQIAWLQIINRSVRQSFGHLVNPMIAQSQRMQDAATRQ